MMVRSLLTLVCTAAIVGVGSPVLAGGCPGCSKIAKTGDGFCCGKGKIFGVELTSKKLYKAVAGKKVDIEKIPCEGCKLAAKKSGVCEHCKVGAADGKMYRSMIAHKLAKGELVTAEKASYCQGCKTAHTDDGFCTGCSAGFVAGRLFKGKENYEAALAAHNTLAKASKVSEKCEKCAVAMVTDGSCEECKVSFKDGKKTG